MAEIIGPRFVSLDLDVVVTGDLTPLFERTEDFVIWAWPFRGTLYNGTMWMMDAGARAKVWTEFDPATSPTKSRLAGFAGSDQAWMNYVRGHVGREGRGGGIPVLPAPEQAPRGRQTGLLPRST
jgi:hypothetical protein